MLTLKLTAYVAGALLFSYLGWKLYFHNRGETLVGLTIAAKGALVFAAVYCAILAAQLLGAPL